jgi:hypothetical protein
VIGQDFTETQAALVCYMAGQGRSPDEIAADATLRATPAQIRALCVTLGLPVASDGADSFRVVLPRSLCAALDCCASARNLGRAEMARQILQVALEGQLVPAIMDDGVMA